MVMLNFSHSHRQKIVDSILQQNQNVNGLSAKIVFFSSEK